MGLPNSKGAQNMPVLSEINDRPPINRIRLGIDALKLEEKTKHGANDNSVPQRRQIASGTNVISSQLDETFSEGWHRNSRITTENFTFEANNTSRSAGISKSSASHKSQMANITKDTAAVVGVKENFLQDTNVDGKTSYYLPLYPKLSALSTVAKRVEMNCPPSLPNEARAKKVSTASLQANLNRRDEFRNKYIIREMEKTAVSSKNIGASCQRSSRPLQMTSGKKREKPKTSAISDVCKSQSVDILEHHLQAITLKEKEETNASHLVSSTGLKSFHKVNKAVQSTPRHSKVRSAGNLSHDLPVNDLSHRLQSCTLTENKTQVQQKVPEGRKGSRHGYRNDNTKLVEQSRKYDSNSVKRGTSRSSTVNRGKTNRAYMNFRSKITFSEGNFLETNLYLRKEDVEQRLILQPNITKGAFSDVKQYLQIQFDLLREDFVGTIRDDIASFTESQPRNTPQIKIYNKATFTDYKYIKNKCGLLVKFEQKGQGNAEFKQGALLGFTNDNFKNYFFVSVLDQSKKGEVIVKIFNDCNISELSGKVFTMFEPQVFYEPYFHVMKALQFVDEDNFPMKEYIISGNCLQKPPAYLRNRKHLYTLGERQDVPVLDLGSENWPTAKELNLNDSQYRAFRAALTQEFVVIQGPPGTGKTFLGLRVAETLLSNTTAWHKGNCPIMVVCYTNHALDQFLEGLIPVTEDLVRIGGRSKSEALKSFNLRNQGKTVGWGFGKVKKCLSNELQESIRDLQTIVVDLQSINKNIGILSPRYLMQMGVLTTKEVMHFGHFRDFNDQLKNNFVSWLLEEDGEYQTENHRVDDFTTFEGFDDGFIMGAPVPLEYCMSESHLELTISNIQKEMSTSQDSEYFWVLEELLQKTYDQLDKLKFYLSSETRANTSLVNYFSNGCDVWNLSLAERWALYKHWEEKLKARLAAIHSSLNKRVHQLEEEFQEVQAKSDVAALEKTLIFGMTTTGAARNRELLNLLRPRIVIVEEAAEVMESHIIASLTPYCEHLILIGDHQQLRPSVNVHELQIRFGFDISLFERMINNGMDSQTLLVQHRMRPEISRLIAPTIYPKLKNHESVYKFSSVKGVTKNLFFLTHSKLEDQISDSLSHKNTYEVKFMIMLCRHFILQGYETKEVTIITTYKAQMMCLMKERDKYPLLHGVRISTVDDFQGEENRIILLSLVRSNLKGKIGFLKTDNRICVALSRAKEGFYMIGNMENLASKSKIWSEIQGTLSQQEAMGSEIVVRCQRHPDKLTAISSPEDFKKTAPEGGCSKPCDIKLGCGHDCLFQCHVVDMEHKERYRCRRKCERIICSENHICKRECWEVCNTKCIELVLRLLPCGHKLELPCHVNWEEYRCEQKVLRRLACEHEVQLPCSYNWKIYKCEEIVHRQAACRHFLDMKCSESMYNAVCKEKCMKSLPCSHKCERECHIKSECPACTTLVMKEFVECGHKTLAFCSADTSKMHCKEKCSKVLPCGHRCAAKCSAPCPPCRIMVSDTLLPCGHKASRQCGTEPVRNDCREQCNKKLACGHQCPALCKEPCIKQCGQLCTFKEHGACGHNIQLPCHKHEHVNADSEELLSYCTVPCQKLLPCGHTCKGSCSKCLQGRLHSPCTEKCNKILICGHRCEAPCFFTCPACPQSYKYVCGHGTQQIKKCFQNLQLCNKPCTRSCEHQKCTKMCGELCSVKPCEQPCKKLLPCGHGCIGYCGDPCPPYCLHCHTNIIAKIHRPANIGDELRFVFLEDCQHTICPSQLSDTTVKCNAEILMLTCPKCGAGIVNTPRYRDFAKTFFDQELAVKALQSRMKRKIEAMRSDDKTVVKTLLKKETTKGGLKAALIAIYGRTVNKYFDAESFHLATCLANEIEKKCQSVEVCNNLSLKCKATACIEMLLKALARQGAYLSSQELEDWKRELIRLEHIGQLCGILNMNSEAGSLLPKAFKILFSPQPYDEHSDDKLKELFHVVNPQCDWKTSAQVSEVYKDMLSKIKGMNAGYWLKSHVSAATASKRQRSDKQKLIDDL